MFSIGQSLTGINQTYGKRELGTKRQLAARTLPTQGWIDEAVPPGAAGA
jgi:hypothetical protein